MKNFWKLDRYFILFSTDLLVESSVIVQRRIFKNIMNNYTWILTVWWKTKIFINFIKCYWISILKLRIDEFKSCCILVSRCIFSFCSDFNLKATVVKTDEIRGLKQLFTPCFLLTGKKNPKQLIINNHHITHQKNHVKNNNDRIFNWQRPYV